MHQSIDGHRVLGMKPKPLCMYARQTWYQLSQAQIHEGQVGTVLRSLERVDMKENLMFSGIRFFLVARTCLMCSEQMEAV